MPLRDIVGNLGDAIAGVDRTGMFIQGQQARADLDKTTADTEAAMELAAQRRIDAELTEIERDTRKRVMAMDAATLADPLRAPLGDLVAGGMGSDYSGAMQGRNAGQQYIDRDIVGTPAGEGLGDMIVTDPMRDASMDALSPASAIASRRPRSPGAPIVVEDPSDPTQTILIPNTGGGPITVDSPTGPVPARPRARPAAIDNEPTTQEQNIDALVARGVPEELAIRVVYNETPDPRGAYTQLYGALRRNFASDQEAELEARGLVEDLYGEGSIEATQEPLIDDGTTDDYAEGEELVNPTTGQRIVLQGGVWVDAETGQPVQ